MIFLYHSLLWYRMFAITHLLRFQHKYIIYRLCIWYAKLIEYNLWVILLFCNKYVHNLSNLKKNKWVSIATSPLSGCGIVLIYFSLVIQWFLKFLSLTMRLRNIFIYTEIIMNKSSHDLQVFYEENPKTLNVLLGNDGERGWTSFSKITD